ncbi:glucose-6-phosphate 1-dehydrogenase [Lachnospiraceae bacterium]|uniref:glucose-6-phosphate dehydrogenase n=1 Tax=Extibacter sp. GGCC_0201 TaxID=2731209 RepID=UPI001AA0F373|nr:glucose-6-phosphate dehydrogenase [Extibacter sp. GGCC_0201]MBO1719285.1 glucose-6-phosphate dehydrogenase [Extibacter sp. GGCC_0201]BDF34055.1 glucose-6-phosphate 1-dehydrogenase [Lachnospiraceae bacterium]BDF38059.1 glucose-6-phosphate 1-dehydrogenase [Lachnospiraceae bacterium]
MNKEQTFTIFGGTGDLTFRKLIPALYNMAAADNEQLNGQIVIIGRRDYTSEEYRKLAGEWVERFARLSYREEIYKELAERIVYYRMDFTDEEEYKGLDEFYRASGAGGHIFYFAVAPRFFGTIVKGLKAVHGAGSGKVVIEKPFGENLKAAEELNIMMEAFFQPDHIYRIDHYLGKEMVRNIQTIRFANPIFSNIWDADHIECIQISALEEVGVETRGGYYDHSGALKDMMQNHLFQILTIVAMDRPQGPGVEEMHGEQMKVLQALALPEDATKSAVLGQYRGYRSEKAVAAHSATETYAALRLFVENDRWRGMPFYIRTGKKLTKREMQVAVVFKSPVPGVPQNILNIKIQPTEGVYLQFNIKRPGELDEIIQAKMDFCQSCSYINQMNTPEAYERLIGACIRGERSWFSQWDQVETSWNYVDALRERYVSQRLPVYAYEPGNAGPDEADRMLERYGHAWFD